MPSENPLAGRALAHVRPTLAQIGAVLGCSGRWIGELRARGVMPVEGATLAENVAAYIAYRVGERG
jgi:hypothetical protein